MTGQEKGLKTRSNKITIAIILHFILTIHLAPLLLHYTSLNAPTLKEEKMKRTRKKCRNRGYYTGYEIVER
jgi:hypothetical protein